MSNPGSPGGHRADVLEGGSDGQKDKEGELVALDYDDDTSKGERAVKVSTKRIVIVYSQYLGHPPR